MDWIQQWQSKLNKQNGVAPLVRTGGSRHTGLAALPYRNIQPVKSYPEIKRLPFIYFQTTEKPVEPKFYGYLTFGHNVILR